MTAEVPFDLEECGLSKRAVPGSKGASGVRLLHTAAKTHATFDDPNLVSHAGLVPAVRLVQNVGWKACLDRSLGCVDRSMRSSLVIFTSGSDLRCGWRP